MRFRFSRVPILVALAWLGTTAAPAADTTDGSAVKKVNINQASATELALLPRVGIKQAERIVEYRKAHGQFGRIEELMEVKGVGEKLFSQLKPYVMLSGPTTLASKVSSRGTRGGSVGKKTAAKSASHSVPVGKGR